MRDTLKKSGTALSFYEACKAFREKEEKEQEVNEKTTEVFTEVAFKFVKHYLGRGLSYKLKELIDKLDTLKTGATSSKMTSIDGSPMTALCRMRCEHKSHEPVFGPLEPREEATDRLNHSVHAGHGGWVASYGYKPRLH